MNKTDETLTKLLNKEIAPSEAMAILNASSDREIEELIETSNVKTKRSKNLSISDVSKMNFLDVRSYCKEKVAAGINLDDLAIELDIKWENGEISGFDYRYFKESVGLKISKEFISRAKSIGRYNK